MNPLEPLLYMRIAILEAGTRVVRGASVVLNSLEPGGMNPQVQLFQEVRHG